MRGSRPKARPLSETNEGPHAVAAPGGSISLFRGDRGGDEAGPFAARLPRVALRGSAVPREALAITDPVARHQRVEQAEPIGARPLGLEWVREPEGGFEWVTVVSWRIEVPHPAGKLVAPGENETP